MIFLAMTGGYYYAFINTLLMAIYLLIREICLYRTQVKRILTDLLQLVGLYLWGLALAMAAFLPTVLDFLSSSRSDVAESAFTLFYPTEHYLRMFLCMVGSSPSGTYWVRLGLARGGVCRSGAPVPALAGAAAGAPAGGGAGALRLPVRAADGQDL